MDASLDPEDEQTGRVRDDLPGIRFFWDFDRQVSRLYGAVSEPAAVAEEADAEDPRRFSVVLDERLRVVEVIPFGDDPGGHVARILAVIKNLAERVPPTCRGSRNA